MEIVSILENIGSLYTMLLITPEELSFPESSQSPVEEGWNLLQDRFGRVFFIIVREKNVYLSIILYFPHILTHYYKKRFKYSSFPEFAMLS